MKATKVRTVVATLAVIAAIGFALAQGGMMGPGGYGGSGYGGWMHGDARTQGSYGPGRHGGAPYGSGMAGGMMGGGMMGGGMMGGGMMGGGMMGMAMGPLPSDATPLPLADLEARLRDVLPQFPAGAEIDDVMPFTNNVYAQVVDASGQGLAELLVDRFTGAVTPEPGPNMMWNVGGGSGFAGMMGAYGGSGRSGPTARGAQARFDLQQAQSVADGFLAGYAAGAKVMASQTFPGYYTFDYGTTRVEGMLSVNAYTGAVWPHTWHGAFLGEEP